eukprot:420155_1
MMSTIGSKQIHTEEKKQNKIDHDESHKSSVSNCAYVGRLKVVLILYQKYIEMNLSEDSLLQQTNIAHVLDDFLHTIKRHDNDCEFEMLFNALPPCNIVKCASFSRNTRDRQNTLCNDTSDAEITSLWFWQILDKIHVYFLHSYDMGHRLTVDEQNSIQHKLSKDDRNIFDNQKVQQLQKMLCNKWRGFLNGIDGHRIAARFKAKQQQLYPLKQNNKVHYFHFGHLFHYDYRLEIPTTFDPKRDEQFIKDIGANRTNPRFHSLKEELIHNEIACITIDQYDNEYQKAMIHVNSLYCKQYYPEQQLWDEGDSVLVSFGIDFVLSLMIYCNYTYFQHEFSKSYRKIHTEAHNSFAHMGENIKRVIHQYLPEILDYHIPKQLHHGVGEILQFQRYIDENHSITIHCPLSTTTSFPVAVHFATDAGMVITFSDFGTKGLDVCWLSDFVNEREFLLAQDSKKQITNIIHLSTGIEFKTILEALKVINGITQSTKDGILGLPKLNLSEKMEILIVKIFHNKLSSNDNTYQEFKSLNKYGRDMIKVYFKTTNKIKINSKILKRSGCNQLFNLFFDIAINCINFKIKTIMELFESIESMTVYYIEIKDTLIQTLYHDLMLLKRNDDIGVLREIKLHSLTNHNEIERMVLEFRKHFSLIGFEIKCDKNNFIVIVRK